MTKLMGLLAVMLMVSGCQGPMQPSTTPTKLTTVSGGSTFLSQTATQGCVLATLSQALKDSNTLHGTLTEGFNNASLELTDQFGYHFEWTGASIHDLRVHSMEDTGNQWCGTANSLTREHVLADSSVSLAWADSTHLSGLQSNHYSLLTPLGFEVDRFYDYLSITLEGKR